jgi:hypothetical protein
MGAAAALIPGIVGIAGGEYAGYKNRQKEAVDKADMGQFAKSLIESQQGPDPRLGGDVPNPMMSTNQLRARAAQRFPSYGESIIKQDLEMRGKPAKYVIYYDQAKGTRRPVPEGTPPNPNEIPIGESDALPKTDKPVGREDSVWQQSLLDANGDTIKANILYQQRTRVGEKPDAPPSGYRRTPDGNLEPIPGGPALTVKRRERLIFDMQTGQAFVADVNDSDIEERIRAGELSLKAPRALSGTEREKLGVIGETATEYSILESSFKDNYVGNLAGAAENLIGRTFKGGGTPGQADWWQRYQAQINNVRNELFGAALTPGEKIEFEKAIITPSMEAGIARTNLARQNKILQRAIDRKRQSYKAGGYNMGEVEPLIQIPPTMDGNSSAVPETATDKNGNKLQLIDNKWVPAP